MAQFPEISGRFFPEVFWRGVEQNLQVDLSVVIWSFDGPNGWWCKARMTYCHGHLPAVEERHSNGFGNHNPITLNQRHECGKNEKRGTHIGFYLQIKRNPNVVTLEWILFLGLHELSDPDTVYLSPSYINIFHPYAIFASFSKAKYNILIHTRVESNVKSSTNGGENYPHDWNKHSWFGSVVI